MEEVGGGQACRHATFSAKLWERNSEMNVSVISYYEN